MKRLSLLSICAAAGLFLAAAPAITVNAGTKGAPYVPKHEFSIQTGCSYNRVLYSVNGNNSFKSVHDKEDLPLEILLPSGLEYTYHFNKHWGITTGAGISLSTLYFEECYGPFKSFNPGQYQADAGTPVIFGKEYSFKDGNTMEGQDFGKFYITIPVMAQVLIPVGKSGAWNIYAQGGLKMGIGIKIESDPEISNVILWDDGDKYKVRDIGCSALPTGQMKEYLGEWEETTVSERIVAQDNVRQFNLFGSLEAGVRIPVYRFIGIYLGAYVDLGLIRPVKPTGKQLFDDGVSTRVPSVFSAAENCADITLDGGTLTVTPSTRPLIKGMLPFSTGLKVKFAF